MENVTGASQCADLEPYHVKSLCLMNTYGWAPKDDYPLIGLYFCSIMFGLPGNALAIKYFTRPVLRRDLCSCLYIAVAIVDLAVCSFQTPVLVSLIAARQPVLFDIAAICVGWRLIFKSLSRLSVFLVLLLSVSRTISLVTPLMVVNKRHVLIALYCYMGYLVIELATLGSQEGYGYDPTGAYCFENGGKNTTYYYHSLYIVTLGTPAIIIFVSFVISVMTIRKSMTKRSIFKETSLCKLPDQLGRERSYISADATKRQATRTIMIFTLTYMVFNLPHFINMILWIIQMSCKVKKNDESCYPGPNYDFYFMYCYSWNISEIFSCGMNSAGNPIIYYCRMSGYRTWLQECRLVRAVRAKMSGQSQRLVFYLRGGGVN